MKLISFIFSVLLIGALAKNTKLDDVAKYRQTPGATAHDITRDVGDYECLVGLPYGYGHLINEIVYIKIKGRIFGPFLVVDVEQEKHAESTNGMKFNGLGADINCPHLYHESAEIILPIKPRIVTKIGKYNTN